MKIACEREECAFMVVADVILLAMPWRSSSAHCRIVSTWCIVRSGEDQIETVVKMASPWQGFEPRIWTF